MERTHRSGSVQHELPVEVSVQSSKEAKLSQVRRNDRSNGSNTDGGRSAGCRMEITTSTRRICRPPITSRARDVVVEQVLGLVDAKERNVGAVGYIE